jgi:hypothetical protein
MFPGLGWGVNPGPIDFVDFPLHLQPLTKYAVDHPKILQRAVFKN